MPYGDRAELKGLREFYVEIQVKRISGADDDLLTRRGISLTIFQTYL